jgi:hypothetical protein
MAEHADDTEGEVDMQLADLDQYLRERGVVSLRLTLSGRGYACLARTAHGRTVTASGQCSVTDAVRRVLATLTAQERERG